MGREIDQNEKAKEISDKMRYWFSLLRDIN
jgi:hypothetical protein